jgi:hypothetical protein
MTEPTTMIAMASFGLLGLAISLVAALRGWQGWLELKRMELTASQGKARAHGGAGELIEMADLRERVRKLENIASYVDL